MFRSFCEDISTIVENRIRLWHGRNDITSIQAKKLIQEGYMLGGFKRRIEHGILPFEFLQMVEIMCLMGQPRIQGKVLIRDYGALYHFYGDF